jgi:hypothetical protein
MKLILEKTSFLGKDKFYRNFVLSILETVLGSKQSAQRNPQLEFVERMKGYTFHGVKEK